MPHYMFQGNYTGEAIRNLINKPEDRAEAAGKLAKAVGGKLREFYMSFGTYDFVTIMDLPDDEAAATLSFAVSAAGHVKNMHTTKLLTPTEATKAMARAGGGKALIKPPKGK
ncbi:MAG TPA: GYD domain-containing protein [Candidatus Cybelea sp.]|nr:GYD domain-containing protein [Candidatus Cybelea sp.]